MRYVDLHCDTLTASDGSSLANFNGQLNVEKLKISNCAAQCFAIFTQGDGAALAFERRLASFGKLLKENQSLLRINTLSDLIRCLNSERTGAILTVENLGFIGGDLSYIERLAEKGVKMASLVWNYENALAYPNLKFNGGVPDFASRENRGLKPHGREAVKLLDEKKIILDISHLSDGGAEEILDGRRIPVVASHSCAAAVCGASRNLTDKLIKKIADCGGIVGVNFCRAFLGDGEAFECVLRHIRRLISAGGEDVVAFGSDFDGIPPTEGLEDCTKMPSLIKYLSDGGISCKVTEKLCYGNFLRVFREICG